jgi:hypothetical protein
MAIGTTVKVGFDGTAVKSGLQKTNGLFRNFAKGITQGIGQGIAKAGIGLLDLVLQKAVMGITDAADAAGELNDQAAQTGLSVDSLVKLAEAFRLTGVPIEDASKVMSKFANALHDAAITEGSPARKALNDLGIYLSDLEGMTLEEKFNKVGQATQNFTGDMESLTAATADLFGMKGVSILRFFRDYDATMAQATRQTAGYRKQLDGQVGAIDEWGDAISRVGNIWNEFATAFVNSYKELYPASGINSLFDSMSDGIASAAVATRDWIIGIKNDIQSQGLIEFIKEKLRDLGQAIGEGIATAIKAAFPGLEMLLPKVKTSVDGGPAKEAGLLDRAKVLYQMMAPTLKAPDTVPKPAVAPPMLPLGVDAGKKIDTTNGLLERILRNPKASAFG